MTFWNIFPVWYDGRNESILVNIDSSLNLHINKPCSSSKVKQKLRNSTKSRKDLTKSDKGNVLLISLLDLGTGNFWDQLKFKKNISLCSIVRNCCDAFNIVIIIYYCTFFSDKVFLLVFSNSNERQNY